MENNVAPAPKPRYQPTPEQKKLSMILCTISMILMFAVPAVEGIITKFGEASHNSGVMQVMYIIGWLLTATAHIAAWVLVIVARVKCKDTFSKVLLIVYLVLLGLTIISLVFIVVCCIACSNHCSIPG